MDQFSKEYFLQIIEKYQSGTATKEEIDFLDAYYIALGVRKSYTDSLDDSRRQLLKEDLRNSVSVNIQNIHKSKLGLFSWSTFRWAVSTAAVIAVVGFWVFYSSQTSDIIKDTNVLQTVENDIVPGGNKAFLTLANGKRISLTDASNGTLAEQAGIKIEKTTDGQLVYTVLSDRKQTLHSENLYNIIETPKGGRYQIRLPDGTNVWLNAASKLTYPSSFAGRQTRNVELSGEAYFEVARDKEHPFIVKTVKQQVVVLGTHFNISSYEDEPAVKTTLLEGSIIVKGTNGGDKILKPGQQSTLTTNNLKVEDINNEQLTVAWKEDQFVFDSDDIRYIMRMIARWYDVEVEYQGEIPENRFGGSISRFENVSEVLKSLESTGRVKFKIDGRRIIVTK
ncbi:FecR family protein [Daejeonella sp. H1SJ63]|jgi:ferric-dicitrate binding protein FerR (iron transport regulator)|uniref:FecR family protein n=1 Tax=Daejeonella sp. H1SJ63 TaxID=3034145 RepID=UPI0023EE2932|nr:FecR family protein [Daejeonella sp. H1SJ63]